VLTAASADPSEAAGSGAGTIVTARVEHPHAGLP
jgi:hypothetical protein